MTMQYDEPLFYSVEQAARRLGIGKTLLCIAALRGMKKRPALAERVGRVWGVRGIRRRESAVPTHCSHLIGECFGLPATAIHVHVQGGSLAWPVRHRL